MDWLKVAKYVACWELGWYGVQLIQRRRVFNRARDAATTTGKPLLVVGIPYGQYPCGDVTLDLAPSTECPVHKQASVESIPYPDKHFGAVFVSHVIEHSCDPQIAMRELHRVADRVFIVFPFAWRLATWFIPGHTWLVTGGSETPRFTRLRETCNIPKYFGEDHANQSCLHQDSSR